jgi:hypothetical protein
VRGIRAGATLALLSLVLLLAACGDDGDEDTTTTTTTPAAQAPSAEPPPGGVEGLPPEFVECMAEQGYTVESSADIHSAPPGVLQSCFGSAH